MKRLLLVVLLLGCGPAAPLQPPPDAGAPGNDAGSDAAPSDGASADVTQPDGGAALTQLAVDMAHLGQVEFGGSGPIGANGCMGTNCSCPDPSVTTTCSTWSFGLQGPFQHLLHALVVQDAVEMASVVTSLEYLYAYQNADGTWPTVGDQGDYFFHHDLGEGLGLMTDSTWWTASTATAPLRARLAALAPKISNGLDYVINGNHYPFQDTSHQHTNVGAAACAGAILVGKWLGNSAFVSAGETLLSTIEQEQLQDGTFQEIDTTLGTTSFDAGYQTVTIGHLWDVWFHDESVQPTLLSHLLLGMSRELQQIMPTWEINFSGSSRTGCGGETYAGAPKQGGGHDL
jgi:hypothetical protein